MDEVTRRRFLLASAVTGGAALAAGASGLTMYQLFLAALRARGTPDAGRHTLVLVTLYGGNDGLNTVIPYTDPAYYAARPELAYGGDQVLKLDDKLGLNPKLPGLKQLWDEKRLAIVLGVGYPRPDRSHFRSMDIWQTASPAAPAHTGWVGRWLDATKAAPEAAVSFEKVLPPLLVGERKAGACVQLGGVALPPGVDAELIAALGLQEPGEPAMQARAAGTFADYLEVDQLVREAQRARTATGGTGSEAALATATGGDNVLASQLELVARCIEAGVPTRVYSVSLGGFDTHAQERTGHEILLAKLDAALTGFTTRMLRTRAGRRVTVVVYSEFGRRVRANASDGTDHGTAGPVFVLGGRVAGGFRGEQPSLADLDDGDLKATVDFRDVFGTVLGSVLAADPAQFLAGYSPTSMPLFLPD